MFGIGTSEILFILLLALLIMGPDDLQKAGRTLGIWMRRFVMSDTWKMLRQTSKELQDLPAKLMREANPDLNTKEMLPDLGTWNRTIQQPLESFDREMKNILQQATAWPPSETTAAPADAPTEAGPKTDTASAHQESETQAEQPPTDSNEAAS